MTPIKKEKNHTILRMERLSANDFESNSNSGEKSGQHIAGGTHQGIIINKQLDSSNYFRFILS